MTAQCSSRKPEPGGASRRVSLLLHRIAPAASGKVQRPNQTGMDGSVVSLSLIIAPEFRLVLTARTTIIAVVLECVRIPVGGDHV